MPEQNKQRKKKKRDQNNEDMPSDSMIVDTDGKDEGNS
tara:strand:+ start:165 stop:278 length:114 start_codon:yes stop_codon:yes gene_type:complete